eukprot:252560-Amphidinium_carterae.1
MGSFVVHARFLGNIDSLSTGPIPALPEAPHVLLSHNLLQGSIPQRLLDGRVLRGGREKWVAASISVS